jgi:hypothetical protein
MQVYSTQTLPATTPLVEHKPKVMDSIDEITSLHQNYHSKKVTYCTVALNIPLVGIKHPIYGM